jgi:ribosomal protein S18 acetylase RimI-like enzyme
MQRPEPEPELEPEPPPEPEPEAPLTALAAAMRRRRAARAPPEVRGDAVAKLQGAAAEAAAAVSPQSRIAPLTPAHTASVLALNHERLPAKVCTEALATRLQSSAAHCLVASGTEDSSDAASAIIEGFVLYEILRGSADVVLLAVQSASARRGLGRALLSAALANAAAAGCCSASLRVRADNAPAVRLYRSLGFETVQSTAGRELAEIEGSGSNICPLADCEAAQLTMQWCL